MRISRSGEVLALERRREKMKVAQMVLLWVAVVSRCRVREEEAPRGRSRE